MKLDAVIQPISYKCGIFVWTDYSPAPHRFALTLFSFLRIIFTVNFLYYGNSNITMKDLHSVLILGIC